MSRDVTCFFCNQHILATMSIDWNRNSYHPDCIGEAVKQYRADHDKPLTEPILPDDYFDHLEESMDEDDAFFDDEIDDDIIERLDNMPEVSDEVLNQIPALATNGHQRNVIIPDVVSTVPIQRTNGNGRHSTLSAGRDAQYIDRAGLLGLPMPQATATHQPIAHLEIVEKLIETLSFRHIQVLAEQYAISTDGMRCFGTLELNNEWDGMTYAIGFKKSSCQMLWK